MTHYLFFNTILGKKNSSLQIRKIFFSLKVTLLIKQFHLFKFMHFIYEYVLLMNAQKNVCILYSEARK